MMSFVYVQFPSVVAACIDRYNDVQPTGSGYLKHLPVTNGDFVILDSLESNGPPAGIAPLLSSNQPARILSISSFLSRNIVNAFTEHHQPGEDETPFSGVLTYGDLDPVRSNGRKSYALVHFFSPQRSRRAQRKNRFFIAVAK